MPNNAFIELHHHEAIQSLMMAAVTRKRNGDNERPLRRLPQAREGVH